MIEISYSPARKDAIIQSLVDLKAEVLNFINGQPRISYTEFYRMYEVAKVYMTEEAERANLGIGQSFERLPILVKPSIFDTNLKLAITGASTDKLSSFLGTSVILILAPLSLPYQLMHMYQEKKIRFQLYRVYNYIEKILWQLIAAD